MAISIHALRGEGDDLAAFHGVNPRTFLSTPSVGRATYRSQYSATWKSISIHALRGEGDVIGQFLHYGPNDFYPRPPWGGRREDGVYRDNYGKISIHALRGEGDGQPSDGAAMAFAFLSTPSVGRATRVAVVGGQLRLFLSTPSVGLSLIHI